MGDEPVREVRVDIVLPAISHDVLSEGLRILTEAIARSGGSVAVQGVLGGEWGYGAHYANEVFEMRPYYWGDCDCGFPEREAEWEAAHPHADNCGYGGWVATDRSGPFVACTCDHGQRYAAAYSRWARTNGHRDTCSLALPNFHHKASGYKVRWYKYIGRGMEIEGEGDFSRLLTECLDSLRHSPITGCGSARLPGR